MHTTREHTAATREEREKQRTRALTRPVWHQPTKPETEEKEPFTGERKAAWKERRKAPQRPSGEERKRGTILKKCPQP